MAVALAASVVAVSSATPASAADKPLLPPITVTLKANAQDTGIQFDIICVLQPLGVTKVGSDAVAAARVSCNALVYSINIGVWLYREGAYVGSDGSVKYWTNSNDALTGGQCTDGDYYAYVSALVTAPWAVPSQVFADNWSPIYPITGC